MKYKTQNSVQYIKLKTVFTWTQNKAVYMKTSLQNTRLFRSVCTWRWVYICAKVSWTYDWSNVDHLSGFSYSRPSKLWPFTSRHLSTGSLITCTWKNTLIITKYIFGYNWSISCRACSLAITQTWLSSTVIIPKLKINFKSAKLISNFSAWNNK